jgi:electron transport complex protein RnfG
MKTGNVKYYAKLTLVLLVITAVVAGLLGLVNAITEDRIAEITEQKTAAAMKAVMPEAETFTEIEYGGDDPLVIGAYRAENASGTNGYVFRVVPMGFGGEIDMVVGVDATGKITGVSIVKMAETSGLGDNAKKESYRNQYVGKSGTLAVTKDGGSIDALTGATVTSRAVTDGVNAALKAAKTFE